MAPFRGTSLLGHTLRLVMVAVCVLPFTGPRQLAGALGCPPPAAALGGQLPSAPVNEEDESERQGDAKARATNPRLDRRPDRHRFDADRPPGALATRHLTTRTQFTLSRPAPEDPFRNGLGSPYRC